VVVNNNTHGRDFRWERIGTKLPTPFSDYQSGLRLSSKLTS